jgi:dual oxidase
MKKDDVFVKKMFLIVDKEKTGTISFQNFLDTVILFTSGSSEDKLGIIFDMCDNDQNGIIQAEELKEMLTSLIAIAKTDQIHQDDVATLLSSMFR